MMLRAIVIVLLLATPAHAVKSIAVVGDSINWGGLTAAAPYDATGYRHSRHSMARTLRSLLAHAPAGNAWKDATVVDWGINASNPTDWTGTPDPTECSTWQDRHPHLKAACRDGAGVINYIPTGYDAVLLMFNGPVGVDAATLDAWVDTLEDLRDALDLVNGTVLVGTPPHGPSSALGAMPADSFRTARIAVDTEMNSRAMITGARPSGDNPMSIDTNHMRDQAYAAQAALWYAVLP